MNSDRNVFNINDENIPCENYDVVIVGSGIAGVYTGLIISEERKICIITKETIDMSNSVLAQGGIAVSLDKEDSPQLHFNDTIKAGCGLCNEETVWVLVNEAAKNIQSLCKYGVNFDKNEKENLSLSREAAHSKNRIIHAGDTTGKEVCDTLISIIRTRENVEIKERHFAVDLLTSDKKCKGLIVYDEDLKIHKIIKTPIVICAAGGFGQIYKNTTNPSVATGDGVCMAYRAGVDVMDMEFIQFHPTVLFHSLNKEFLISEAVRGEGGLLKNIHNECFMSKYHELAELAPRDVVSRAIFAEMKKTNSSFVYLDISFKEEEYLKNRFPNIYKTCLEYGIDITKDCIPVAPAEHYCMGGIKTDIFGRTNLEGFYACGEVACNGIHGANRLASNSLLEGLVFGYKIGEEINSILNTNNYKFDEVIKLEQNKNKIEFDIDVNEIKKEIQLLMTDRVGIIRNEESLINAKSVVDKYLEKFSNYKYQFSKEYELINILTICKLVIEGALMRLESRGAHYRTDYPTINNENYQKHFIFNIQRDWWSEDV